MNGTGLLRLFGLINVFVNSGPLKSQKARTAVLVTSSNEAIVLGTMPKVPVTTTYTLVGASPGCRLAMIRLAEVAPETVEPVAWPPLAMGATELLFASA